MKLAVRIADREMPVDGLVLDIALGDVGIDASVQGFFIVNSTGKACTRQNGEFHFSQPSLKGDRSVEPTVVPGRVMELQILGDTRTFSRGNGS
jgi:hypothetical protein